MDKAEKKRIWQDLQAEKRKAFNDSMPLPRKTLWELFHYIDDHIRAEGCNNKLRFAEEFLLSRDIPAEPVLKWLEANGGYCDCEVMYNVMELFYDDAIF